jgi:hypothetical protein
MDIVNDHDDDDDDDDSDATVELGPRMGEQGAFFHE